MLVMLTALIAQVRTNPYTTGALNAIEFCSLLFTVLIMVCGMAFRMVRIINACPVMLSFVIMHDEDGHDKESIIGSWSHHDDLA